jgi:hypothetical protein
MGLNVSKLRRNAEVARIAHARGFRIQWHTRAATPATFASQANIPHQRLVHPKNNAVHPN